MIEGIAQRCREHEDEASDAAGAWARARVCERTHGSSWTKASVMTRA